MDDRLKKKFWNKQKYLETFKSKKNKYRIKALLMTLFPTYIMYYHLYESSIRKHSFLLQLIVIYNLFKLSQIILVANDINKIDFDIEITEGEQLIK